VPLHKFSGHGNLLAGASVPLVKIFENQHEEKYLAPIDRKGYQKSEEFVRWNSQSGTFPFIVEVDKSVRMKKNDA